MRVAPISWAVATGLTAILLAGAVTAVAIGLLAIDAPNPRPPGTLISRQ